MSVSDEKYNNLLEKYDELKAENITLKTKNKQLKEEFNRLSKWAQNLAKQFKKLRNKLSATNKELEKHKNGDIEKKLKKERDYWQERFYKKNAAWENKYNLLRKRYDNEKARFNSELKTYTEGKVKQEKKRPKEFESFYDVKSNQELLDKFQKIIEEKDAIIVNKNKIIKSLKEKNDSLQKSMAKDFTNSSLPSSATIRRKKIPNLRPKTDKKVGAQEGHKGHGRKRLKPTEPIVYIPVDDKFKDSSKYKETNEYKYRDEVDISFEVKVVRYASQIFVEKKSGRKKFSTFPERIKNETNYGPELKSFMFILNNYSNCAINKITDLVANITNNKITPCNATVCNILKEFKNNAKEGIKQIEEDLLTKPVLGADFTNARCDGKNMQTLVTIADDAAKFYARERKGQDGIKDSVIENFEQTVVCDHDAAIRKCGSTHQECLAHIMRNLKGVFENEQKATWAKSMFKSLSAMIKARNELVDDASQGGPLPEKIIDKSIKMYDRALDLGANYYEAHPPSRYNRDGYNLYLVLEKFRANVLLFLYDTRVPPTNNASERALRKVKRKIKQMTTFRAFNSFSAYCDALSLLTTWDLNDKNIYSETKQIFSSP